MDLNFQLELTHFFLLRLRYRYEKMISGMYMGEVVRLVLAQLTREGLLFDGMGPELIFERGQFLTKFVSEIERYTRWSLNRAGTPSWLNRFRLCRHSDKQGDYSGCRLVLEQLGLDEASDEDCANVRYVCELVSRRAAYLAAAGVATLINKMGHKHVTVAVDGSVYRFHPHFHDLMVEKIQQLVNPGTTVKDILAPQIEPSSNRLFFFDFLLHTVWFDAFGRRKWSRRCHCGWSGSPDSQTMSVLINLDITFPLSISSWN